MEVPFVRQSESGRVSTLNHGQEGSHHSFHFHPWRAGHVLDKCKPTTDTCEALNDKQNNNKNNISDTL